MSKKQDILNFLDEVVTNPHCELNYNNNYELLISIILSAQTTDQNVNRITVDLFKKYPDALSLSEAKYEDVYEMIRTLGLAKAKSRNIIETAKIIKEGIPEDFEQLTTLPGVGRKTANCFLAEAFNAQRFGVDTHVLRVSKRLGLSSGKSALEAENSLTKYFKDENFKRLHHQFILFGRYFCMAKNPKCEECKLEEYCKK